jgi:DNA-binding HxlR family transcriptional regulator
MAAEILGSRWTIPVLRELLCGSRRFNELRKGVPRMSPALLSQRLRDLEQAGIVRREQNPAGGSEYRLTEAGEDLRGVVEGIGGWGQRWVDAEISLRNLDASLLMWDMRRRIDPKPIPMPRAVIQFLYPEQTRTRQRWWLIIDNGTTDLCAVDPGFDVDLYIRCDLRTMTRVWMGLTTVVAEESAGTLTLVGNPSLKRTAQQWLGFSIFAGHEKNRDAHVAMRVA